MTAYYFNADNSGIWYDWNYTATTTVTTANTVWPMWMDGTNVWPAWIATTADTSTTAITYQGQVVNGQIIWGGWSNYVEETQEQKRERLEREQRQREEAAVRLAKLQEEQAAAVAKAEELLREHLTVEQTGDYERLKAFLVKAQSGKTYRIRKGWSGNVELLNDDGAAIMRFCIHPSEVCPEQDNMLAQKLLLEADEEAFNRIANKTLLGVAA